jgi:hypothetical protein
MAMKVDIDYVNMGLTAEEEFLLVEYTSGKINELPDEVKEKMTVAEAEDLDSGEWLMIVDGELERLGNSHPFLIHAYLEEDRKKPLTDMTRSELEEEARRVGISETRSRPIYDLQEELLSARRTSE